MIERTLRILPALNHILVRTGEPISVKDVATLKSILSALTPFKQAILNLCSQEADRIFLMMFHDLDGIKTELSELLSGNLKMEIAKRRTILSTALAVLFDRNYKFKLETMIGVERPTYNNIFAVFAELLNAESTMPPDESCGAEGSPEVSM